MSYFGGKFQDMSQCEFLELNTLGIEYTQSQLKCSVIFISQSVSFFLFSSFNPFPLSFLLFGSLSAFTLFLPRLFFASLHDHFSFLLTHLIFCFCVTLLTLSGHRTLPPAAVSLKLKQ